MDGATQQLAAPVAAPGERRLVQVRTVEWFDVGLVVAIAIVYAVVLPASDIPAGDLWPTIGAAALMTAPLLWRSRAPVVAWALVIALQVMLVLAVPESARAAAGITFLSPLIALGAVAARRPVWVSLIACPPTYACMVAGMLAGAPSDSTGWALTISTVACAIAWGLGILAHRHHRHLARLQREHESTGAAVAAERSRIASELNGIVEDAVRAMLRDAASARAAAIEDRHRAVAAFASIEARGVEAMHELRRLLHLLHDEPSLRAADPVDAHERGDHAEPAELRRRSMAVTAWDVAVTAATVAATVTFAMTSLPPAARIPASIWLSVALCALLWRRAFPVAMLALVIAAHAGVILVVLDGSFERGSMTAYPAVLVALAAVAAASSMRISMPALGIAYAYLSLSSFAYPEVLVPNLTTLGVLTTAVWLGGMLAGRRKREIARLEADASRAQHTVEQERARLAYDLHDVIGHAITVMALQAAGAGRIIAHDLDRALASLPPIEEAGAEALAELDELVGLLSGGSSSTAAPSPRHGLADLAPLIERTRRGVDSVTLITDGNPGRLEPSVDLAAYSVVREALSNVVKHAGSTAWVEVAVSWSDAAVLVSVVNARTAGDDAPRADLSGGFGLVHVRERVRIAGGDLRWAREDDVFRVEASFPVGSPIVP